MSAEGLIDAISYLTEETDDKKPQVRVEDALGTLEGVAKREGLTPDQIDSLMEFVSGRGGERVSSRSRVVRSLIPQTTVPCSAILKALGCLRSLPITLQQLLLRWTVLVFELIDDRTALHAVYTAVFYLLQADDLRPIVCQLLCYLTRREDVTEFRVQKLAELQKHVLVFKGTEAPLTALLTVYKTYRPHLVAMALPGRRKVWFRQFERVLAADIKRVQEMKGVGETRTQSTTGKLHEHLQPPPAKRARQGGTTIPAITPQPPLLTTRDQVSVSQLTSLDDLCNNIGNIELPSQMAAVLESSLLRHVFAIWSDPSAALRVTYWLQYTLGYELDEYSPGSESPHVRHLLSCLADLTEFILEPIPVVESFLAILLEVWNGRDYQKEILHLLTHLSLQPFEDLKEEYLDPLNQLFVSNDVTFKCDILSCLTELLRNFAQLEWHRYQKRVEDKQQRRIFSFSREEEEQEDFDPLLTMKMVVKYVDHLILIALEEEGSHAHLQHAATSFHELVVELPETHGVSLISLPHKVMVFRNLLGGNAAMLSRTCSVLVGCKDNFSRLERSQRHLQSTVTFNSIVLDFCDGLWRNLAFSSDQRPYPTLLFRLTREFLSSCNCHSPQERLSVIHHPAMVGFVIKFFEETQSENRLLQPSAIWQEAHFKESYLDFLKENHLKGLVDFIRTFVRSRT